MGVFKSVVLVVALLASSVGGFFGGARYGRTTAPKVHVYNLSTKSFVPLVLKKDVDLFVAGPSGPQPGIKVMETKEGSKILVFPIELAADTDSVQPQSSHERLSHAEVLRSTSY